MKPEWFSAMITSKLSQGNHNSLNQWQILQFRANIHTHNKYKGVNIHHFLNIEDGKVFSQAQYHSLVINSWLINHFLAFKPTI